METLPPKGRSGGDKSRRPPAQKRSRIKDHGGVRMTEISSFYEEEDDELCPTLKEACRQGLFHPTLTWKEAIGDDPDWDSYLPKDEPPNEGSFPKLNITAEEYKKLWEPWRKTLIVKILGKSPAFNLLFSKLRSLWNLKAKLSLVDIGNDFYLVKVENPEDYLRILTEGPWVVGGYYLTVRKWKPFFNSSEETVLCTSVWSKTLLPWSCLIRLTRSRQSRFEKEKGPLGTRMVAQRRDKTKKQQSATMAAVETSVNNGELTDYASNASDSSDDWTDDSSDDWTDDSSEDGSEMGKQISMLTEKKQGATAMELPHQNNQKHTKKVEEKDPFGPWMVAQRREKTKKQLPTMAVGWPPEDVNVIIDILSRLPVKSILRFSGGTYDDDVGHGSYFDSRASSCDYDFDGSDPFFFK
ncbi:hypothetical protein COLO4_11918 [Corchorus olitorius]|uniref:DUF4283 domain-containing protein n=1 Tax=Corchorus olitorius TaxID=93759 RepID=A0A1R3K2U8_9ROSI|nr:hypothetical protein COLO4_11918 [Corchorus olitorius]